MGIKVPQKGFENNTVGERLIAGIKEGINGIRNATVGAAKAIAILSVLSACQEIRPFEEPDAEREIDTAPDKGIETDESIPGDEGTDESLTINDAELSDLNVDLGPDMAPDMTPDMGPVELDMLLDTAPDESTEADESIPGCEWTRNR